MQISRKRVWQSTISEYVGDHDHPAPPFASQWLECYDRNFCQVHLSHLKERPSSRKDVISNFQNSQKIPLREKLSHFKVQLNNRR